MPDVNIRWTWSGRQALSLLEKIELEALWYVGQEVLRVGMNDVPMETGTLRRSGCVSVGGLPDGDDVYDSALNGVPTFSQTDVTPEGTEKAVYVSYNTPYAIRQHEDLTYHHAHGRAKWMETALPIAWAKLERYVAHVRKKWGV